MSEIENKNRIAVLMSGQLRTFDRCIKNMRENLFYLGCDTYVHTSPDPGHEEQIALHDFTGVCVEEDPDFGDYSHWPGRPEHFKLERWDQRILSQLWKNLRVWQQIEDKDYDWVVRLRPDTALTCKFTFMDLLKPGTLHIPQSDSHMGHNDRFGIGDYSVMRAYMRRHEELDDYLGYGGILHSEENLRYTMLKHGIPVEMLPMDVWLRRIDHDQRLVRGKYEKRLKRWGNIVHPRDKGNWTKAYEDSKGRYVDPAGYKPGP